MLSAGKCPRILSKMDFYFLRTSRATACTPAGTPYKIPQMSAINPGMMSKYPGLPKYCAAQESGEFREGLARKKKLVPS